MKRADLFAALILLGFLSARIIPAQASAPNEMDQGFVHPPDRAKPWVFWFWMGGNITKEAITADLEAMKKVGLGGAMIMEIGCPTPGAVKYMSDEWRRCIKHAADEAKRLGLDLGIHNGPGWSSSGGPWITPDLSMKMVVSSEASVAGPGKVALTIPQPFSRLGLYKDIAVFAIPSAGETMREAAPNITSNCPGFDPKILIDGNWTTSIKLPNPKPAAPNHILFEFDKPFMARSFTVVVGPKRGAFGGYLEASEDGTQFKKIQDVTLTNSGQNQVMFGGGFNKVTARYFRLVMTRAAGEVMEIPMAEIELSPDLRLNNWGGKTAFNASSKGAPLKASAEEAIPADKIVDCSAKMKPDGSFEWDAPAGEWRILRIGYTSTGAEKHPGIDGGNGLECDKLSRRGFDAHWNGVMARVLADGARFNMVEIDSYEVGPQTWTEEFREEFQKRRGYDMLPYLPALTGRVIQSPGITERFCWDFRQTVADLFADYYEGEFAEKCRRNNLRSYREPYGAPSYFDEIASGLSCDVPMDTFWNDEKKITGHRKSSISVAHTNNRPIVAAEAFTSAREKAGWRESPYSMKALGDDRFCAGVNQFVIHRYALQAWPNALPGIAMGACGIHFERTNTWWEEAPAWTTYLSRCQYLLQRGRWVGDIACFTGEEVPDKIREAPVPAGYHYDLIHPKILAGMKVEDGALVLPHGMKYRLLVLPKESASMTVETARKIRELVSQGAVVLGSRPARVPSLAGYPASEKELKQIAEEVWGDCDGKKVWERTFGKGRILCGKTVAEALAGIDCMPDFDHSGSDEITFTHRIDGATDIYFVARKSRIPAVVDCTFRVHGRAPEFFHPDTGKIEPCPLWREAGGRVTLPIAFDPAGSVFVVFRKKPQDHLVQAQAVGREKALKDARAEEPTLKIESTSTGYMLTANQAGAYRLVAASGKEKKVVFDSIPDPMEIKGPWEVGFAPGWGAPEKIDFDNLISWPRHENPAIKYFSGSAVYRKTLSIPDSFKAKGRKLFLDLGDVQVLARVHLNGKDLGCLWKPPFRIEITDALLSGENRLEVKVVNLWPNRLIGDEQLPEDCRFTPGGALSQLPDWFVKGTPRTSGRKTFTSWKHWRKDARPLPSGLIGPARIIAAETRSIDLDIPEPSVVRFSANSATTQSHHLK